MYSNLFPSVGDMKLCCVSCLKSESGRGTVMYSQDDNYDATERSDILQEVKCPVFSTKMF